MKLTAEQIERANLVSLPQFLMSNGFELKKSGREYIWKEHDSLHIYDNETGERGRWFRFSEDKGGDNISFVREYMGKSFVEAVEMLNGEKYERTVFHRSRPKDTVPTEITISENTDAKRVFAYLCRTRGLDYDMIADLVRQGLIVQEHKTGNVVFKITDENGKLVGAEKVGTSTQHKYKGIATGSASGYGFEICKGNGENLLFFESSIDLLSYLQMYEPDHHRLVSMMGVKPGIVLETMHRYGIPPGNVYLCSDNDKAGNEFAERLMSEYPEMKRIVTTERYKDWNDMLRDIPKQKQEAQMINYYGNKIWHDATDNREKSIVTMSVYDFETFQQKLDNSGINYYAYSRDDSVSIAIADKDLAWFGQLSGVPDISARKSTQSYVPPEKNIFGTAEYRYIPDKTYISADRDTILKMAELMQREDIQFSGRVYPTGKGTLTISNSDRYRVNGIQRSVENMRKQFAEQKKADVIGNRAYRNIREKHYYHSRLTAKQYDEIKPFLETNASYSGIIRDDKVIFTVEKRDAQNFQRSLDTAIREVAMIHSMQALNMPMDRMAELSPLMHRLAMEDAQIQLDSFFDARYDDAQFGEMISLVNAYLDQPVYERYGEHSRLSEMLDAKNSFDRSIELSDFFSQHEFSHEQKSAITAMFVGDVTRAQIDVIDETFTAEEIQQFGEILHNSLDENAVNEFLENRTKPELTEMEQAFLESAIEPVMAKSVLAWDEIEDLGYIFFEEGYIDKYSASDRAMYGNGVYEKDIYEIADRMRHGDNIHADLTRALLGNQQTFTTKNDHTFHVTYNKEDITATFGNAERSVSYDAVGEAFLSLFENEYKDILKAREEEKRKEAEAETPQEEKQDYVAFSWGKDPEWFTESEILYDFAKQHPTVSLALANAVFEYLDEKQHTERAIPELNAGWYKKSDFVISGVQNGEDFNYEGRFDIGDGKGTGGGSLIDHIRDFQTGIINSDRYPYDNSERKAAAQESLDVFIPFLEAHSKLTAEEMQILAEFKAEYPIRTEPLIEKAHGTFRIMQLPPAQDENDPYHGIRFFSKAANADAHLNHEDYTQVYEGNLSDYPADRILESIYERMNIGEKPDGYTGHSLSVSDVIITDIDGVETAYYCNDVGFTEMPEYFREKEILPEIYQLITNGGLDGGIDRKKEYATIDEAVNAGYKYMSEGYHGFCVVNTETQTIERTVGDFPYEKAFSPEFLKNNGLWGAAHDAQQLMEEQDKPVTLRDVVDRYFGTDCESAETADGEWKITIYDGTSENLLNGDIVGVLYHNSEPVVDIHNNRGDFTLVARTSEAEQIAHDIADIMHDRRPDQNFSITVAETQEKTDIVADFKAKTDEMFHAVDGYTPHEIENVVKSFVFTTFYENGITADIGDIAVTGSRSRGIETENSDIDVVVEIRNSELKEDALFNILHEEGMDIGGITVDINPIRPEETGTLESYLPTAEAYLSEKMKSEPVIDDTMIRISEEQALAYFDNDRFAVYLVYDDGTEGQAQNRDEIISHTGELGIEKAEWDKYQAQLDTAKSYINEFCEKEFDTEADFSNIFRVDLAYTTDEETGIEVQSYADLENYRIVKEYDGKAVSTEQYDSLTDMCGTLQNLEFGDLVYLSDEEKGVENAEQEPEKDAVNTEETVSIEEAVDEDAPLFADADVIEQIQEDEKADVPFWETPVIEGEQLSLFGDEPVPMKSERKPAERNTKSSHTAEELEYLKAELMRGTGFEDGKFRMQEYFEENHPSVQEFAQKLKNEFGIGGHSGYGDVSFADHDSKGISIEFKDHSKLNFSWNEAAKMLTDMINRGEYITEKDIQERIRHAKYIVENISPDTEDIYDKRQLEKAHNILEKYNGAEVLAEKPVQESVVSDTKIEEPMEKPTADDDFDLKSALAQAVSKLSADISNEPARDVYAKTAEGTQVQIPSNLRNYSFFMQDDKVYFKKNNAACEFRFDKKNAQHGRVRAFIEMRDLTRELIEAQEMNKPDAVITDLQEKLNQAYDTFYAKYGLIHSQTNKRYFSEDVSYNLVAGLEKKYDKTQIIEKSDIFTKRTIQPPKAVDHVETSMEALTLSVAEKAKVDFEYMSSLTGKTEDELKQDLVGEIFKVPHTENEYQTASEYLSGDIRKKLKAAEEVAEYDADFNINVTALNAAMPEPLKAGDIDVKLGATWIDPKIYEQFMYETFQTPSSNRADRPQSRWSKPSLIKAEYSEHTGSWHITNKAADRSVLTRQKFGSHHMNAYDILEHILNLKEPKVYKTVEVPDGMGDTKEKRVVDIDATRVVQRKAEDIRKAFKSWIFRDPERREAIVQKYNELFNSVKPREYDGSALTFPMMNSDIHLHEHQKNAIAHAMFGGNTLFAHCVGAGKTFEMIATAMESKRLGLCTKSMFAVPNHLTEQIGDDFQKLYPGANILVATKKDFQKENRQQLFAKIATGNFDAVIIGHSQLGMIPMSVERQKAMIQGQIDDIILGIEELKKSEGSKFQIKSMERTRKSLEKQLSKLEKSHDDTVTFEQLGVDKLFVDEAHECTTRSLLKRLRTGIHFLVELIFRQTE